MKRTEDPSFENNISISISVPPKLLEEMKASAKLQGCNLSEFLRGLFKTWKQYEGERNGN